MVIKYCGSAFNHISGLKSKFLIISLLEQFLYEFEICIKFKVSKCKISSRCAKQNLIDMNILKTI